MKAICLVKVGVFALALSVGSHSPAAMLSPGDIVVASLGELSDEGDGALVKLNPLTGDRTIITGPGVGSGPGFDPQGIAVATLTDLFVVEPLGPFSTESSVFHVDVATGNRQVIASSTIGSGPVIQLPADVLVRSDGKLIIADASSNSLVLIDPVTLERNILSGVGVGTGPSFSAPLGMTSDVNGDIFFTATRTIDPSIALFKMNAFTGDREVISAIDIGGGQDPGFWIDVALDDTGRALTTNHGLFSPIFSVDAIDLATGDRTILSGGGIGMGPPLLQPWGIGIEANGRILVADQEGVIIQIDPTTGDRTIMSGAGIGSGPTLLNPQFLDIVPVPEPSSLILLGSGIAFNILVGWRRCGVAKR